MINHVAELLLLLLMKKDAALPFVDTITNCVKLMNKNSINSMVRP